MSQLDIELAEFCESAVKKYGHADVCDALCSLMTAMALETSSSDYYLAIDEAVAVCDATKLESLAQETSGFLESIGRRYGEKASVFELIRSIAASAARTRDNTHIRRIAEIYYEKISFYRTLLRKARH